MNTLFLSYVLMPHTYLLFIHSLTPLYTPPTLNTYYLHPLFICTPISYPTNPCLGRDESSTEARVVIKKMRGFRSDGDVEVGCRGVVV